METNKEYPFYPELTETGKEEAQKIINDFKIKAKNILDNLLDDYLRNVYCNIVTEIESDSWQNYRNTILSAFKDYGNKNKREYDFKEIRQKIYLENKKEIDNDLNQDNLEKIILLEKQIEFLQENRRINNY